MTARGRFSILAIAIASGLAAAAGGYGIYRVWLAGGPNASPTGPVGPVDGRLPTTPVSRPASPPADGYVGSSACKKCHEEICQTFAQHPMGKSAALTPGPADLEDFSAEKSEFTSRNGTRYKVERTGGQVFHHEIGTDQQGRVLYDQAVPVSLAIGSGTRGKTYGVNHEGILLQSPISWYSAKGGYFELSPGYEGSTNPRFSRRLQEECLLCHVGRMEFDPETPDKLVSPYFHELSIGCERCHGPGEKHIQARQAGKPLSPDDTIVNPARLPMRERESVCYQCHLHGAYRQVRYGRHERDFRPGMALEEISCVLVEDESSLGGLSKAVSQVEQMWDSACFRKSEGKMGCISCHNPHEWPTTEKRIEYYRVRCNECHSLRGCSLSQQERDLKQDSCIACHMPQTTPKDVAHASQTDHRVLKRQPASKQPFPGQKGDTRLKFFDDAERRLPQWEVQRARGMAMVAGSLKRGDEDVEALLKPLAKIAPDDAPLHVTLGAFYLSRKNNPEARKSLEAAVASEPKNELALASLANTCFLLGDLPGAKRYIARAVELNPYASRYLLLQAATLAGLGENKSAILAGERAAELDPSDVQIRQWLLNAAP